MGAMYSSEVLDTCGPNMINRVAEQIPVRRFRNGVAHHLGTDRWSSEVHRRDAGVQIRRILAAEYLALGALLLWRTLRRQQQQQQQQQHQQQKQKQLQQQDARPLTERNAD